MYQFGAKKESPWVKQKNSLFSDGPSYRFHENSDYHQLADILSHFIFKIKSNVLK